MIYRPEWTRAVCLVLATLHGLHCSPGAGPGDLGRQEPSPTPETNSWLDTTGLRQLAIHLFQEFSNPSTLNGYIMKTFGTTKYQPPAHVIGAIYENYTMSQFAVLYEELRLDPDNKLYEPILVKVRQLHVNFRRSIAQYRGDGDLKQFEAKFLDTGSKLVSIQKLVLRIVNSRLEEEEDKALPKYSSTDVNLSALANSSSSSSVNQGKTKQGKMNTWLTEIFDDLSNLFFGKFVRFFFQDCFNKLDVLQVSPT